MKNFKQLITLCIVCSFFALNLTGCGSKNAKSYSGNNDTDKNDLSEDLSDATKDVADGVVDGAKDVADGIGDATDDLLGDGGFDNYSDAHDYFLEAMSNYHSDAKFELRNEDKKLNNYQEGSKGYHFYLYDTSRNKDGEQFGEFYVDATSGRIYQKGNDNSISEYPATSGKLSSQNGYFTSKQGKVYVR